MFEWFGCVGRAVLNKGVRGLVELVPGGAVALEVAGDAARLHRERQRAADLKAEVVGLVGDGLRKAGQAAEEVARETAGRGPVEERLTLEVEPAEGELPLAEELPPPAPAAKPAARPRVVFAGGPLEGGDLVPVFRSRQAQHQG